MTKITILVRTIQEAENKRKLQRKLKLKLFDNIMKLNEMKNDLYVVTVKNSVFEIISTINYYQYIILFHSLTYSLNEKSQAIFKFYLFLIKYSLRK